MKKKQELETGLTRTTGDDMVQSHTNVTVGVARTIARSCDCGCGQDNS